MFYCLVLYALTLRAQKVLQKALQRGNARVGLAACCGPRALAEAVREDCSEALGVESVLICVLEDLSQKGHDIDEDVVVDRGQLSEEALGPARHGYPVKVCALRGVRGGFRDWLSTYSRSLLSSCRHRLLRMHCRRSSKTHVSGHERGWNHGFGQREEKLEQGLGKAVRGNLETVKAGSSVQTFAQPLHLSRAFSVE